MINDNSLFSYSQFKEQKNILPYTIENKDQYYFDLQNIEHSWTGRLDLMFSNQFFEEAVQLLTNAIVLFEKGYFDCAFYSLRQSLEICTTVIYFADDSEPQRNDEMNKWRTQKRFPMHGQMLAELEKRKSVFSEIRQAMSQYFDEIEESKQKLNKYVHKQGFDKFYVNRNNWLNFKKDDQRIKILSDFESFLIKSMGAVAVFRLAIDPFPLLLLDEAIYNRTGQLMTEGYSEDFVNKYIGQIHIEAYKKTELYKSHYDGIIGEEEMLPAVVNLVKNDYIDRRTLGEINSQKHLLGQNELIAVSLAEFSDNISKIYCIGGFHWYITNTRSKRTSMSWSSSDFDIFKNGSVQYNVPYDEAYLSQLKILEEDYYIEHNEQFSDEEIVGLNKIVRAFE